MWTDVPDIRTARLLAYDTERFGFADWLARVLYKVPALDQLHDHARRYREDRGLSGALGYQDNLHLRARMQNLPDESPFYALYHAFIRTMIKPAFGGRISYTNHPKMRVHLAGTTSVSKWHRDADVTGREDQIVVWLPFTDCAGSNTLWIESDYGRGDYRPVAVRYGQALVFDGGYLAHGTVTNDSEATRVSLDFRFAVAGPTLPDDIRTIFSERPPDIKEKGDRQAGSRMGCPSGE